MKAYIWFKTYARKLDALSHFINAFTGDKLPSKLVIYLVIDFTVISNSHQSPYWNNLWNLALINLTWSGNLIQDYNTNFPNHLATKEFDLVIFTFLDIMMVCNSSFYFHTSFYQLLPCAFFIDFKIGIGMKS